MASLSYRSLLRIIRSMASAKAAASSGGTSIPFSSLTKSSGPMQRVAITGSPVVVAEGQVLQRLLPELSLNRAQLRDPAALMELLRLLHPELRARLILYRAVGTESAMLLAIPCTCTEEGPQKPRPILVAFSPTPISDGGLYEAIVNT